VDRSKYIAAVSYQAKELPAEFPDPRCDLHRDIRYLRLLFARVGSTFVRNAGGVKRDVVDEVAGALGLGTAPAECVFPVHAKTVVFKTTRRASANPEGENKTKLSQNEALKARVQSSEGKDFNRLYQAAHYDSPRRITDCRSISQSPVRGSSIASWSLTDSRQHC